MKNKRSTKSRYPRSQRGYLRTARLNEVLREVLADKLERLESDNEHLGMLTVTAVECDPDLRHATVMLSSMSESDKAALESARVGLQAAIADQLQLRRTPQLRFVADPAVAAGLRIEEILSHLPPSAEHVYEADPTAEPDLEPTGGAEGV